jgi:hypothetical protein
LAAATTREAGLLKKQREVEEREQQLALDMERKLAEETKRIREQEAKAAEERFARVAKEQARDTDQELADARRKLSEATAKEAGLLKKQREVEEREQRLALDLEAFAGDLQRTDGRQLADLPQLAPPPSQAPDTASLDGEGPDSARADGAVARAEDAEPEDAELQDAEAEDAELEDAEPEDAFLELFPNDGARIRNKPAATRLPLGAKRPPGELVKLTERLGGYIKENPGRGIEAIGSALVMPTSELSLPIKKLLAAQKIRCVGAKRATKYFPA